MSKAIIPSRTEHAPALHGLVRKRAELAGEVEQHRAALRRLAKDLDHLDATIRLLNPEIPIGRIAAKMPRPPHAAEHGEMTRAIIDGLREADQPMTSWELAQVYLERQKLDSEDAELVALVARRVRACLRAHRARGRLRAVPLPEGPQGWELANRA